MHTGIKYIFTVLWSLLLSNWITQSYAQQSPKPDSLKLQKLQDVNIKIYNKKDQQTLVPVQTLRGNALERLNALSVADALRHFSGLQIKDYGGVGGLKTINVRSMGTNHTAVFYDGIAITNAQNGQVDLGRFSLENMEELSLYNGQKPDLLQPAAAYASASSVYLKSKMPVFRERKSYNLQAGIKAGSFGLLNPSANLDYRLSSQNSLRISSEYLKANGRYKFHYTNEVYDTTAVRNNGDIDALRLETSLYGKKDSSFYWTAKVYFYNSQRGLPGAIVSNKFNYTQRLEDQNIFIQATLNKAWKKYAIAFNGKYAEDFSQYTDPEYITLWGGLKNQYKQKNLYLSLAQQYSLTPFLEVALASDFLNNYMDANLYRFSYPTRNTLLNAIAANFHWKQLTVSSSLLSTAVWEHVRYYSKPENRQKLNPTFIIGWQPFTTQDLHIRAFYKSIFRMPTFNDLYYTLVGNTNLKPEDTEQYNVGLSYTHSSNKAFIDFFEIQADIYRNTITNKIIAIPGANLFRWTMYNLGKTSITGVETNIKLVKAIGKHNVSTNISYTLQHAVDNDRKSTSYKEQIPYTPKHSGSFTASLYNNKYAVNYSFIYTGERYSQPSNIRVNYLQPWYTHDISANYHIRLANRDLAIQGEINNLLNQTYDVIVNFPMPGRYYRLGIKYQL